MVVGRVCTKYVWTTTYITVSYWRSWAVSANNPSFKKKVDMTTAWLATVRLPFSAESPLAISRSIYGTVYVTQDHHDLSSVLVGRLHVEIEITLGDWLISASRQIVRSPSLHTCRIRKKDIYYTDPNGKKRWVGGVHSMSTRSC